MKTFALLIISVFLTGCIHEEAIGLEHLEVFQWEKRIILVSEDGEEGLKQLVSNKDEIEERDVIWFRISNGVINTNYNDIIKEGFIKYLNNDFFTQQGLPVLLIGKDGTVKSRDRKLDLHSYFQLIDSMPMRQQEMGLE